MKQSKRGVQGLTVVGSVALDTIKTPYGQVERALGGSAVYFSCAARFFTQVRLVGVVGDDFLNQHVALLEKLGIDLTGLERVKGKTFHWKGRYTDNLNEAITEKTELNVFANFVPKLLKQHVESQYLFLANIHPKIQYQVLQDVARPKWIACDTMNFWIQSARKDLLQVLKHVDISLMNDSEIKMFTGEHQIAKAVKALMKLGPKIVIVKRGEYGAWCFCGKKYYAMPAVLLSELKDPTGAGDSFAGGFLGYLAKSGKTSAETVKDAAVYGTVVASFNVQSFSLDRLALLTQRELIKRRSDYLKSIL